MKTRKTSQMNENKKGTPTGDTTTQFKWIPERSVGSTEVSIIRSNVEEVRAEMEGLKRRLEVMEEREAVNGREQSRRETSRVRLKNAYQF